MLLPLPVRWVIAAVLSGALCAQTPLPPPVAPPGNPTTAAKSVLGKVLFFDEQLSSNGRVACGTCHRPEAGGGDTRRRRHPGADGVLLTADDTWGSPGLERRDAFGRYVPDPAFAFEERVTRRAALATAAAPWFDEQFWDGRVTGTLVDPETGAVVLPTGASLEAQSLHPLVDSVEMAREGRPWADIRSRVATIRPLALATNLPADVQQALAGGAGYPDLFAAAFGDPTVTMARIAMALASYQRSSVPDQTPWDLHAAGVPNALSPDQLAGLQIFQGEAGCHHCHTPGLFSDKQYRALGLTPVAQDPGRGGVTGVPSDLGTFKVPSLRNAALKTTFLHNGRFTSMAQVVNFYRNGAGAFSPRDSLLQPFGIDQVETTQLLDFLENALVDPRARLGLPPFDRPTLFTESWPIGQNMFGAATATGSFTPQLLAQAPPFLGNPEWSVGVTSGPPGAVGWILLGLQGQPPGTQYAGVTLHAFPDLMIPLALDANGASTMVLPVPMWPVLSGFPLYGQGVFQSGATWCGTRGAVLTFR